uniref:Beta-galactosidase n=1 Tax=Amphiprion ocellaris TaxID=80972 RepID=A0AAQ5ZY52_AMPOC
PPMVVLRIRSGHKRKYALVCLCIVGFLMYRYLGTPATRWRMSRKVGLAANTSQFTLEGEPFHILGGSIHYFRVPRAYWRDRLVKMKACGINTLTTYVPWSLHQPERKGFNFHTQLDLEAYINLAAELGLWVILRPGPYISSELDLGGLPSWLLQDGSMRLRTTHPGFTQAVNSFFDKLIPKVVPLQFKKGGPIIAVQVENEYGSFAKDQSYMLFIKEALQSRGISELLLTSDNHNTLKSGGVDGDIQDLNAIQPNSPTMVMDYWTGWYDVWGDLHHVLPPEDMVSTMREILRRGMSVNLYMFHGGSSFGFMSGALASPSYRALVPSYGAVRDLFAVFFPDMPALHYREAYEPAIMYQHLSLWDALSFTEGPFKSAKPVNMENLPVNSRNGQSYGYTLYETTITSGGLYDIMLRNKGTCFVECDGCRSVGCFAVETIKRHKSDPSLQGQRTLSLLVENCGRVHQGRDLDKQHKGLVGDILLNNIPLRDFTIYSLDMKPSFIDRFVLFIEYNTLNASRIHLWTPQGWEKGVVFINGLNLGRYWSIGPQQTLYLPGPFLNSGINQVIVFEEQEGDYKVNFEDMPDLGMAADIQ